MKKLSIDKKYLTSILRQLLEIPSPSGYTDRIVHFVSEELERVGVSCEHTRRGAIRADLPGKQSSPDRAIVAHVDTIGAMVKNLKPNGRLEIVPIGTWSSRFAEGARVTIFTEEHAFRGTILPMKASGHVYDKQVDAQPTTWENLEVRVDEKCQSMADLQKLGIQVGSFLAVDPQPEFHDNGFINSRHLDDKAGVAALLTAAKAIVQAKAPLEVDCHLLFTIAEELGSGASAVLHQDVAELVGIDNAIPAPGQNSSEFGVTIAIADSTGPFDYHLTHKMLNLCKDFQIDVTRDVFTNYRSDAASAIEAGSDIRSALVCFGVDASHGYERTHVESLAALAQLLSLYIQSPPTAQRDRRTLAPLTGLPDQTADLEPEEK